MSKKKRRRLVSLVSGLLLLLVTAVGQHYGWFDQAQQTVTTNSPGLYSVSRFVDGDTIVVDMNGNDEIVRMIGIDTPETHKPNTPVQCYGPAAATYVKNTVGTSKVRLESDPQSQNRDRYKRLLRYVYLADGRLLEEEMIKNGYGFAYTQFPFTKSDQFVKAQDEARIAMRGLWAACKPEQQPNGRWQTENAS